MTLVLLTCCVITLGTLVYVFYLPGSLQMGPEKTRVAYLRERKEAVYENLRDLNFENKSGKFLDADFLSMKASLEEEAAGILAEIARIEQGVEFAAPAARAKKGARV